MQVWLTSPTLQATPLDGSEHWVRGPFLIFEPRTFVRQKMGEDMIVDCSLLEATKPAAVYLKELEVEGR
jgi:hypothetical protein